MRWVIPAAPPPNPLRLHGVVLTSAHGLYLHLCLPTSEAVRFQVARCEAGRTHLVRTPPMGWMFVSPSSYSVSHSHNFGLRTCRGKSFTANKSGMCYPGLRNPGTSVKTFQKTCCFYTEWSIGGLYQNLWHEFNFGPYRLTTIPITEGALIEFVGKYLSWKQE
jgi:hypothetical protein